MSIRENLSDVRARVERACASVSRDPAGVTLIAVTKNVPSDAIAQAYDLGLRDFGESRLQEAETKLAALPRDITWHFIGALQSNKAKRVVGLFDVVHTLSNERQLAQIARAEGQIEAFVEVNIAKEAQKAGIYADSLDEFVNLVLHLPHVYLRGLMTVGPALGDPEEMRIYFRSLKEMAGKFGLEWTSMGMSGDFEVAIQEGATHIRIGAALFGARS